MEGSAEEMSDEALVLACSVGDAAALGALFDRHHRAIYRFLSRASLARAAGDVDDLVQTTFLEVWRSASSFRRQGSARSWLYGVAANVARHVARSEGRRRSAHESMAELPSPGCPRPDEVVARRQLVDRLGQALRALPHDLRVAFVMCDLEGIAGVDAARALGVREGTMWRRLHHARRALRSILEGPR